MSAPIDSGVRERRAHALFLAALRRRPEERESFLLERCEGDAALRADVESLLSHHDAAQQFLEPKPPATGSAGAEWSPLPPGTQVGRYRILDVLGAGGMGMVYVAQQESPRRTVALKLVRPGLVSPRLLRRFEREAEVLALLQHPGIAQVYEAGTVQTARGPRPYFAMELVRGRPLGEIAPALPRAARLELFARICDAVQHAHAKGVIHRDLKPANIVVDADGQPKVLDFGIARVAGPEASLSSMTTQGAQLIGTIPYMSPEQIGGQPTDTRSDIYALGVILYELVSGRLPHDTLARGVPDAIRAIREDSPTPLRSIDRALAGDVETIAARALEKDPDRRYASAAAIAEDIRRHLANEPIVAKQDSALYVLRKKLRRYPWAVAAALVFVVLLSAFGLWAWVQARAFETLARSEAAAKNEALANEHTAQARLRASNIQRARLLAVDRDIGSAEDLLWEAMAEQPGAPDAYWGLWELYRRFPCERAIGDPGQMIVSARFSPDGRTIATAHESGAVHLWESGTGRPIWTVMMGGRPYALRFSPDGRTIATCGLDEAIRLWDAATGAPAGELADGAAGVREVAFFPDSRRLISGGVDSIVRVWDLQSRAVAQRWPATGEEIRAIRLDPRGGRFALGDQAGTLQIRDVQTGQVIRSVAAHNGHVLSLSYRPDGGAIATSGTDYRLVLWDADDAHELAQTQAAAHTPRAIEFSRDGSVLVSTQSFATIVLDGATLKPAGTELPLLQGGWEAEYSPDNAALLTTALPDVLRLWRTAPRPCYRTIQAQHAPVIAMAASPDGTVLATGGPDGVIVLRDPESERELHRFRADARVRWLDFSPDGARLAAAMADGLVRVYDAKSGSEVWTHRVHARAAEVAIFFPDGERIATAGAGGLVRVWRPGQGPDGGTDLELAGPPSDVLGMSFSPDGRWLVATMRGNSLVIWDARTLKVRTSMTGLPYSAWSPVFGPDSRTVLTGSFGGPLQLVEPFEARSVRVLPGHAQFALRAMFSPEGDIAVSLSSDGVLNVWDPRAGQCVASLKGCGDEVGSAAWLPGGRRVAVGYRSGDVEIWDLAFHERNILNNADYHIGVLARDPATAGLAQRLREWVASRGGTAVK